MLTLPHSLSSSLRLTPAHFAELCAANPEAVLELASDGRVITMTPTGGETGSRSAELLFQLKLWARSHTSWLAFDSSTGFQLPDGSVLSPDASLVRLEHWRALSPTQRRGFPPLCPDLVVKLASPSDEGQRGITALHQKMVTYRSNGASLGWLLLPEQEIVEIWTQEQDAPLRLERVNRLEGGTLLPDLQIDLAAIWAA